MTTLRFPLCDYILVDSGKAQINHHTKKSRENNLLVLLQI